MMSDIRLFRRTDPDFPTTLATQQSLVAAGRVEGEGPLASTTLTPGRPHGPAPTLATINGSSVAHVAIGGDKRGSDDATRPATTLPLPTNPAVPIGETRQGTLHLDLTRLLAGRLLIQGSSGAGKSATLRHLIEEAHDYLTVIIVDPEGEFANLAAHIGAATITAREIATDGLTAAALRARHHRLPLHVDLSDLEPDVRIQKAAAFFAGLLASPQPDWAHTVLVAIDEAHLLAPHMAASARDAETRRLGVATLTELCARGRKRGICPVLATQRLAKLSTNVVSELQNVLLGLNIHDTDVARAGDLLGFKAAKAAVLQTLRPGEFYAFGPALCAEPRLVRVAATVTTHTATTPHLVESADVTPEETRTLLDLDALREAGRTSPSPAMAGGRGAARALDTFLLDPQAGVAARVVAALRPIAPNGTTAADLAASLRVDGNSIDAALDLLAASGAVDTMPRGATRIARLSARLRLRGTEVTVVGLA